MSKRKLGLVLVLVLLMSTLAGCMQVETGIKVNKDGSAAVTMMMAYNEDMMGADEGEGEVDLKEEIGDLEGVEVKIEKVEYKDNGFNFVGEKAIIEVENIEQFLKENDDMGTEELKIIDLGNGKKRIEMTAVGEDTVGGDAEGMEMLTMLLATGFKMDYIIEVEGKVIDSNATSFEGNVYKWDLLKLAESNPNESNFTLYLEYTEDENAVVEPKEEDTLRDKVEKELALLITDGDFHGNALSKLGVLKGTDKGLELDKSLTRAEGAVMYSRLLGLEKEIEDFAVNNSEYKTPFTDIPTWVKPTINYLYSEGLIKGISETKYGAEDSMTEEQYATLVLRALGYEDEKDFVWSEANNKMIELGFFVNDGIEYSNVLGGEFNRRKMSYISYNALFQGDLTGVELLHRIK